MVQNLASIILIMTVLAGGALCIICAIQMMRRQAVANQMALLLEAEPQKPKALQNLSSILEKIGSFLTRENEAGSELGQLLVKTGYSGNAALHIFAALRAGTALAGVLLVLVLRGGLLAPDIMTMAMALIAFVIFYRVPMIMLKLVGERRTRKIREEFPPTIDIILMTLDSGISIDQCLRYASGSVAKSAPIISAILTRHVKDVDSGTPYDTSLDRLGLRLGIEEGYDFVNIIKQSLLYGGELTSTLRRFGSELSDKRLAKAREEVGRSSTHLTLVMIAFFIPVLLVVLAGPAFVNLTTILKNASYSMQENKANAK